MTSPETPQGQGQNHGPRHTPRPSREGLDQAQIVPRPDPAHFDSAREPSVEAAERRQDTSVYKSPRAQEIASLREAAEASSRASSRNQALRKAAVVAVVAVTFFSLGRCSAGSSTEGKPSAEDIPTAEYDIDNWNVKCEGETPDTIPAGGNFSDAVASHVSIVPPENEADPALPFSVVLAAQADKNDLDDANSVNPDVLYFFDDSCRADLSN